MNKSIYIAHEEVMELLGIGQKKAYEIIKAVNTELAAKGFITLRGKAPRKYLLYRLGIIPPDETIKRVNTRIAAAPSRNVIGITPLQVVGGGGQ